MDLNYLTKAGFLKLRIFRAKGHGNVSGDPTAFKAEDDDEGARTINGNLGANTRKHLQDSYSQENSFVGQDRGVTVAGSEVAVRENMTPTEELQLVRRQIAKLNHRLMAVELENQQQQQREMIFTILLTAYFFGKFVMWVNRNS